MVKAVKKSRPGPPTKVKRHDQSESDSNNYEITMSNIETEANLNESDNDNDDDEVVISLEDYNEGIDKMSEVSNNGSQKIMCSVCKLVFNEKGGLDEHFRNVSSFHHSEAIAIPITSKSDRKVFGCSRCNEEFDNKVNLNEHLRAVHMDHVVTADLSAFKQCSKCEMKFFNRHSLEDHMRLSHPEVMTIDGIGELEVLSVGTLRQDQLDQVFELEVNDDHKKETRKRKKRKKQLNVGEMTNDGSSADESVDDEGEITGNFSFTNNDEIIDEENINVSGISNDADEVTSHNVTGEKKKVRITYTCAVQSCPNPQDVKYFCFPLDKELKKVWIHRCSRKEGTLPKVPRICENHFDKDAYLPDNISRNTGLTVTKRLNKKSAIPTLKLNKDFPSPIKGLDVQKDKPVDVEPKRYKAFKKCSVVGCEGKDAISTHTFPKDNDKVRQKKWLDACGIKNFANCDRVCGLHFTKDSFVRSLKGELLGIQHKKRLKSDAVPTIGVQLKADNLYGNEVLDADVNAMNDNNDDVNDDVNVDISNDVGGPSNESVSNKKREECEIESCDAPVEPLFPFPEDTNRVMAWYLAHSKWKGNKIKDAKVCSSHFLEDDIEKELYLSTKGVEVEKRNLKPDAVPSQNLEKVLTEALRNDMANNENVILVTRKGRLDQRNKGKEKPEMVTVRAQCDLPYDSKANERLRKIIRRKDDKIGKMRREIGGLKKDVRQLGSKKMIKSHVVDALTKKGFPKGAQNCIMNPAQKSYNYTKEDIAQAVVIRGISPKAYRLLKATSKIPIPDRRTQERWLARIPKQTGFQYHSIEMLKCMAKNTKLKNYNYAMITFDEVHISQRYEMDLKTQKIYGNVSKLQMVMMRGLVQPWKEPIWYNFNTNMTLDLMKQIIVKMEEAYFWIKGVIFDLGNKQFISKKGVGLREHKYFFKNPYDESRCVYVIPDTPHLLKCARNALLAKGFLYEGVDLRLKHFQEIKSEDYGELKCMYKLTDEHLHFKGLKKQIVRLAAQLLSNTVAKMMTSGKRERNWQWQKRAKIVKLFSDWFDVSNSGLKYGKNNLECGFGVHHDDQYKALNNMELFLNNFSVFNGVVDDEGNEGTDGYSHMEWWHGMIVQIKALKGLYSDMVKNGPLDFILTRRCNQDCLENYFSKFRSIHGDNTKPGPVQSMIRIRNLLFAKNAKFLVMNPNVEMEKNESEHDGTNINEEDLNFIFDEFEQEDVLSASTERFTNDLHLTNSNVESEVPSNLEVANDYPDHVLVEEYNDDDDTDVDEESNDDDDTDVDEESNDDENTDEVITFGVKCDVNALKKSDCSFQGLTYILGSIAKKLQEKYPQLGKASKYLTQVEKEDTLCTWLLKISNGRLMVPNDEFLIDGQEMEEEFNKFHACKKRVDMDAWVINRFTSVLVSKFGDKYDREVLYLFATTRTHIRIKDLNRELKNREAYALNLRDMKQLGQLQTFKLSDEPETFSPFGNSDAYYQSLALDFLKQCEDDKN